MLIRGLQPAEFAPRIRGVGGKHMGRQLRILFPGAVYHVTSRGNERKNIFSDDMYRRMLLKLVGEARQKFGFKVFDPIPFLSFSANKHPKANFA